MIRQDEPNFEGVLLDAKTIPQEHLNIDNKERSNLFPWNGQFSPQLIETILRTYASAGSVVLDPFLGSGTVLHESGRLGYSAFGSEVNPAAFKMAEIYRFINAKPARRKNVVSDADAIIRESLPAAPSLFSPGKQLSIPLHEVLSNEAKKVDDKPVRTLLEVLVVLLNFGDHELTPDSVLSTWVKLQQTVRDLPYSESLIEPTNADARALPIADQRADIVITSPPYINVFNYHQQYRRSVESLGWDLLEVARSEIGSNRKHRGNRFLTVIQYCIDMKAVLDELRRVCKPGARIIVVVGRESNVRKTKFFNGEIVARLAVQSAGYRLLSRQERVFQNRFGDMIYEDILHLTPVQPYTVGTPAKEIAGETLVAAIERAPAESLNDLKSALEKLADVSPSPLYDSRSALTVGQAQKFKEVV